MRAVSLKSLCLLAGFVVPCLGSSSQAEAGVIPWLYNSIFGYGWGHNYGGYGGGVPYSVGYGSMGYGYGGYGYSAASYPTYAPSYSNFGYGAAPSSCGCSSGISSAPLMSAPTYSTPTPVNSTPSNSDPANDDGTNDPNVKTHYQPSAAYYDYYTGYTPAYVVDSGSCCVPCTSCGGGDCASPSVKSSKPEAQPTPALPDKKDLKEDDFKGTQEGAGKGTGANTEGGYSPDEAGDVLPNNNNLPSNEITPARRPGAAGEVGTDSGDLEPPVKDDSSPDDGVREQGGAAPSDRSIAVRYNPTLKRSPIAIPASVARVVRVDRTSRTVMAAKPETHSQVAVKP